MQEKAPRRKAVNVTIDASLLAEARAAGVNLSATLEAALQKEIADQLGRSWREKNRAAIEASNAELAKNGMWHTPDWLAV